MGTNAIRNYVVVLEQILLLFLLQQSHLLLLPTSWVCKEELDWLINFGLCLLVLGIQVTADISGKRTFTSI